MAPEKVRRRWGFVGPGAATLTLLAASPAVAQSINANALIGAAPLTIALGAGGFALLAMALLRRLLKDAKTARANKTVKKPRKTVQTAAQKLGAAPLKKS